MKIPMALWPRLMPLLDQALDQPADQREAWLQQQNLDEVTAAALRQLLADRQELDSGDFMAALPQLSAPASSPGDGPGDGPGGADTGISQSGLFAGDMLGPYRLIRQLGQGGMSVVWLAERDDGQMRRRVALKMPHAGPGQALLIERLRRERDILASLEHRHIARLYDVGVSPMGLPFLVLEYIEGETLPAYCDQHKLGLHDRLRLFLQVLSAVQYAHTKLVLHRDLKPSNILVNQQGEVKLLDFGIAKLIRDSETGAAPSTELTQHNGHVLTPDYAAPEQIAGKPLTTASDVYALGVILFELLTGQRPYRLPRGTRGALEEAILATDPRRPSTVWQDADVQTHHPTAVTLSDLAEHYHASARRLSQQLRGDLDVIVATALQKQTARRYATAEAFAQDINHHLAKEPIAAQPDSRWYRSRKYVQRHAWALSAVGAVVLALSVGLGLALWQAKEARQEAAKANAIKDFLVGLFENGDVEQADALRKRQQTVEQLLVDSARALSVQLKDQPEVRVQLQGVVGGLLHNLALTDASIAIRQQRAEQLTAMNADVAERAQAWRDLADSQDARGDTAAARSSLDRGYNLCAGNNMLPVTLCYGIQVAKAQLLLKARDIRGAQQLIAPALQQLSAHAVNTQPHAEALVAMGDLLSLQNDDKASFAKYEESMAIRARLWGKHSVRLAQERYQLAMSLAQVGRFAQALQELQDAHSTMVTALGRDHVNSAAIELQLGRLRSSIGVSGSGGDLVAHASKVILSNLSSVDPRTVFQAHLAQGELALFDGRLSEVGQHLIEAIRLQSALGDAVPIDGRIETAMAWYLDDIGRATEARATLSEAKARLTKRLGAQHPYVLAIDEAMGASYLAENNLAQAAKWLGAPAGNQNEGLGAAQPPISTGQAALLMAMGRFDQAAAAVVARYESVDRIPRNDQFRLAIYSASDQMGRLKMGQKKPREARPYFERAIHTLVDGYPGNPYLAATRARYGLCLFAMGDHAGALKQANLAAKALRAQSSVAYHFKAPLDELSKLLATPVATGM